MAHEVVEQSLRYVDEPEDGVVNDFAFVAHDFCFRVRIGWDDGQMVSVYRLCTLGSKPLNRQFTPFKLSV